MDLSNVWVQLGLGVVLVVFLSALAAIVYVVKEMRQAIKKVRRNDS